MTRSFLALLLLGTLSALAQTPARKPRTLSGGVCGTADWVCVARCIDSACIDDCLRKGCEQALDRLRSCTQKAGCAPKDTACSARTCGATCQHSFEPAPPSPEKEKPQPCQGFQVEGHGRVPPEVVGRWVLSAATLTVDTQKHPGELNPKPRPDYKRTLEVTPEGCFVMSTALQEATLGQGNSLTVRSWGSFDVTGDDTVSLRTQDGQAVGPVCGKPRVVSLSKGDFQGPSYTFSVENGTLTLVARDASKRTFQFQRPRGEDAQGPAKK